jgi:hypothetical protein
VAIRLTAERTTGRRATATPTGVLTRGLGMWLSRLTGSPIDAARAAEVDCSG